MTYSVDLRKKVLEFVSSGEAQLDAAKHFDGTCNAGIFNIWLEQFLLSELSKNQTIIMETVDSS